MSKSLNVVPVDLDEANAFVVAHHRHHGAVAGHKFSLGCAKDQRNAASFLYGAAARAAFALGYSRIGTYILASEPGSSLKAVGWRLIGRVQGRSWSCPSRPRVDTHPLQDKMLFEKAVIE